MGAYLLEVEPADSSFDFPKLAAAFSVVVLEPMKIESVQIPNGGTYWMTPNQDIDIVLEAFGDLRMGLEVVREVNWNLFRESDEIRSPIQSDGKGLILTENEQQFRFFINTSNYTRVELKSWCTQYTVTAKSNQSLAEFTFSIKIRSGKFPVRLLICIYLTLSFSRILPSFTSDSVLQHISLIF